MFPRFTVVQRPRAISAGLLVLPAGLATALLWAGTRHLPAWTGAEPIVLSGVVVGACLGLTVLAMAVGRAKLVAVRRDLEVIRSREMLVDDSVDLDQSSAVGLGYPPAWAVVLLIWGGTAALRFGAIELSTLPWWPQIGEAWLPAAVTALLWGAAGAALIIHRRARRLTYERRAAQYGTRLAVDSFEHLPVMVSVCRLDGTRKHFNARFREIAVTSEEQFSGTQWLERVHEDDRPLFDALFGEECALKRGGKGLTEEFRQIEYGIVGADGNNRWIRERFVPRYRGDGRMIGYLAVGFDITAQIENETENAVERERWQEKLRQHQVEAEQQRKAADKARKLAEKAAGKLEGLEKAKDRLEQRVEKMRDNTRSLDQKLSDNRQILTQARADLSVMKAEYQKLKAENRKLTQTLGRRHKQVEKLEINATALKGEVESNATLLDQAKSESTEARQIESHLRTKVNRLTQRTQELEEKLAEAVNTGEQAIDQAIRHQSDAEAVAAEHTRDLAGLLRPQVEAVRRAAALLPPAGMDEDQLQALDQARAASAAVGVMLDGVLGPRSTENPPPAESVHRSFDLRAAVRSVAKLLEDGGRERGVEVDCVIHSEFPPLVCGDAVRLREAVLLLGLRTLQSVKAGRLTLELRPDGLSPAMVAAQCRLTHEGDDTPLEMMRQRFALDADLDEADDTPDAGRAEALAARRLVRDAQGDFTLESTPDGGFVVSFTVNLNRRETVDAPRPVVAPSEPAPELSSELTPKSAPAPSPKPTPAAATKAVTDGPVALAKRLFGKTDPKPTEASPTPSAITPKAAAPRVPQEMLDADLGKVLELGAQSIVLESRKPLEGILPVVLFPSGEDQVELCAQVDACDKTGPRCYAVRMTFVETTPQLQKQVTQIAMSHRPQTTLRPAT
ncbi:MAG: PAS domain-containing protein [Planctomycetota bacterium]